jgi:hypothetical protein
MKRHGNLAVLRTEEPSRSPTLSEKLWKIDWSKYLPVKLGDSGITLDQGSYEVNSRFAAEHLPEIYETDRFSSAFRAGETNDAKPIYYRELVDFLSFIEESSGRLIGIATGLPSDWSTYYIRHCALIPEMQGKHVGHHYIAVLIAALTDAKVSRLECDVSPANLLNINMLNKHRFNVTGVTLSERWGSLLRLTRFLDRECETVFLDQFCWGVRHQLK